MDILINRLDEIQSKFGWLPEYEIEKVAEAFDIPKAKLYGIISFYSRFYTKPASKYILRICKSISCSMNNSLAVRQAILDAIGQSEADQELFMVELVECLGHCNLAPALMVNDDIYGNMTPESAVELIEALRVKARCSE